MVRALRAGTGAADDGRHDHHGHLGRRNLDDRGRTRDGRTTSDCHPPDVPHCDLLLNVVPSDDPQCDGPPSYDPECDGPPSCGHRFDGRRNCDHRYDDAQSCGPHFGDHRIAARRSIHRRDDVDRRFDHRDARSTVDLLPDDHQTVGHFVDRPDLRHPGANRVGRHWPGRRVDLRRNRVMTNRSRVMTDPNRADGVRRSNGSRPDALRSDAMNEDGLQP